MSLSTYLMIKFIVLSIHDVNQPPSKDVELGWVDHSAPTKTTKTVTSATDRIRDIYGGDLNCSTDFLGVPWYVEKSGCSGWNFRHCAKLTCGNLLRGGDDEVYKLAKEFMDKHERKLPTDEEIAKEVDDCDGFKRLRGFQLEPMSENDILFPIAFNILVHVDLNQMVRLLRAIYRPQHSYCVHVDGKLPSLFIEGVRKVTKCFDNVFVASKLESIVYAGFSRLQADINCMKDHFRRSTATWKYLVNTAAQSFPLQTPEDMVRILKVYNGSNDIEGIHGDRVLRFRFEREWVERIDTMTVNQTGKANRPPPHDIDIVRGSAFGIFSRQFVEFILTDRRSLDLLEWSKKTYSPDEHFWATLHHTYSNPHLHTPGGYSGPPNDKPWLAVFVKWGVPSNCHGRFVRGVCILGVADLPDLIIRKELFVNKFYENYQPLALDCLEAWIRHRELCPVSLDLNFYKDLPFVNRRLKFLS